MLRLTGIPFRKSRGTEFRTAPSTRGVGPQCSELSNLACVHCAHFGRRIGSYVGRIGPESACFRGSPQCLRGSECSSSPTSGTCFPCSGACGPLNVYKSPFMGPCRGPFLLVAAGLAAPSLGWDSGVGVYFFMAGGAWTCMTCCDLRIKSSWSSLSVAGTRGKALPCPRRCSRASGIGRVNRSVLGRPGRRRPEQPPRLRLILAVSCSRRSAIVDVDRALGGHPALA